MSTVNLADATYIVRQGENRAAALRLIERDTDTVLKRQDIESMSYTIFRRGTQRSIQMTTPTDEPVPGHIDREIPVNESIRDDPQPDPFDGVAYNFLHIIRCVEDDGTDITPFTEAGAVYDMVIRIFPFIGGKKYAMQRTIRIECE